MRVMHVSGTSVSMIDTFSWIEMVAQSKSLDPAENGYVFTGKTAERIEHTKGRIREAFIQGIDPAQDQIQWSVVRIISSMFFMIVVDYLLMNMSPYIRTFFNLLIAHILDLMDSIPLQIVYGKEWCKTRDYVTADKVGDMSVYAFVLIMHFLIVGSQIGYFEIWFTFLYFYRLIGVILSIQTKNDVYLVLFPDLFGITPMVYIFFAYIWIVSPTWILFLTLLTIPLWFGYEAFHHLYYQHTFV